MNSNLPRLTPTHNNQILIHPEHAAGTLTVKTHNSSSHHSVKAINIFAVLAIAFLIVTLLTAYFFIPRTKVVMFAAASKTSVENLDDKASEVNTSLNTLYSSLTASSASEDSDLSEIKANVLSANTSAATNTLLGNSVFLLMSAKEFSEKTGLVQGFSVPESDPNKFVREQRKLAEAVTDKTVAAQALLTIEFSELNSQDLPSSADPLQTELKSLADKTGQYLSESEKTSKYYIAISDAAIDLYKISASLTTLNDIDNSVSDLTKIRNKFANYDEKLLPSEINPLNQDVVAVFDLLIEFFKIAKSGSNETTLTAYNNFLTQTQTIATQTALHELNFWQNNKPLSSYEALAESYNNLGQKAEQIKADNNYFLLPLLGVK